MSLLRGDQTHDRQSNSFFIVDPSRGMVLGGFSGNVYRTSVRPYRRRRSHRAEDLLRKCCFRPRRSSWQLPCLFYKDNGGGIQGYDGGSSDVFRAEGEEISDAGCWGLMGRIWLGGGV